MSEPSWTDLYDLGKATLESRQPRAVVQDGNVFDSILAGTATIAFSLVGYAAGRFRAMFLDGARGQDLTDLAHDRGVDREPGSGAVGSVTLSRVSSAAGAGTLLAGHRIATDPDDNGEYTIVTLDEDAVFGPLTLSVTGAVTAQKVGVSGNVASGSLIRLIDPAFDPTIIVTNAERLAGGVDEESDEDLRDRVRGFYLTQARGTIEALEFGARQVDGVDRVSISVDESGIVTVYVADAQGNSNSTLVANVAAELEHWRDAADVVYVTGGVILLQAVSIQLTVRTGVSIPALLTRVRQAIVSHLGRLNPGETLYKGGIESAVRAVDPDGIVGVEVIIPAVNVAPADNELLRTNDGLIDINGS